MTKPVSLIIADDHKMVLEAMRHVLENEPHLRVVATANTGDEALEFIKLHQPDVALIDVDMPGPGAAAIAQQVIDAGMSARLIAVTMHVETQLAARLLGSGYCGYVIKDEAVSDLTAAIETVLQGDIFVSKTIAALQDAHHKPAASLTPREVECLKAAEEGLPNQAIADRHNITLRTVKYHFENIFRKLETSNRSEAVAVARRLHLL